MPLRFPKRLVIAMLVIVGLLVVTIAAGGFLLFQRYVTTDYADAETAAREFAEAQVRLAGQVPLT